MHSVANLSKVNTYILGTIDWIEPKIVTCQQDPFQILDVSFLKNLRRLELLGTEI